VEIWRASPFWISTGADDRQRRLPHISSDFRLRDLGTKRRSPEPMNLFRRDVLWIYSESLSYYVERGRRLGLGKNPNHPV
jgi:hypothetical protein